MLYHYVYDCMSGEVLGTRDSVVNKPEVVLCLLKPSWGNVH